MAIEQIMSKALITLTIDDDLAKAKDLFDNNNIHHILILHNKTLVGVITDRDLYKHLSPAIGTAKETHKDAALLQKKIHLMMNRNLVTAKKELSINKAVLLFNDNHISCLPVVDDNFAVLGIITWRDILKTVAQQYLKKIKQSA